MGEIKIFTDSTCDLTDELLVNYDISFVPLYVNFEDEAYKDRVDINTEELYRKVEECGKLPKTSAPSPVDFYNAFKPYIEKGMDILYIGLSSLLSSTIQNAKIAAMDFPEGRIEVVDSLNLSSAIGLLALRAADLANQSVSLSEVANAIHGLIPKVRTAFVIDTLDYLHKGGRCTAVQSFVGSILKIKPVIRIIDGKIILWEKLRGKREKALQSLIGSILEHQDETSRGRIMITHSMGYNDALYLKKKLSISINPEDIYITDAGCVISSHCGPNTVGILYIAN